MNVGAVGTGCPRCGKGHEGPCEYAAAEFHDAQAAYALEDKYRDYERWASAGDRLERAWRAVAERK